MMKSSRPEEYRYIEENIIRDERKIFRLRKLKKNPKKHDATIEGITNLFWLKKENKAIKCRILRSIRNLFEHEDYYKPVRIGNFWSNSYIECKSKGDWKTLSVKKYLNKIRTYFK